MSGPQIFVIGDSNVLPNEIVKNISVKSLVLIPSVEFIPRDSIVQSVIIDRPRILINDIAKEATLIQSLRRNYPTCFLVIYEPDAAYHPHYRLLCFDSGCNMVAHDVKSLTNTLIKAVILSTTEKGARIYTCPYCRLTGLTELELWTHAPTYHVNLPNSTRVSETCPICHQYYKRSLQVHIHERHGPMTPSKSSMTQLYCFALVVCRHPLTGRFLLCQEFSNQDSLITVNIGAVDNDETLTIAAKRETMEEAGIAIDLKGILSLEYNPVGMYDSQSAYDLYLVRIRCVFYAEPTIEELNTLPKSSPDFESVGACWCLPEDILNIESNPLKLRGNEPRQWIKYLQNGGTIYPLTLLREKEG